MFIDDGIVLMCRRGGDMWWRQRRGGCGWFLYPCYPLMVMYDDAVMQGLIVAIVDLMFLSTNSYCYYLVWVRKKFRVNYFFVVTGKQHGTLSFTRGHGLPQILM